MNYPQIKAIRDRVGMLSYFILLNTDDMEEFLKDVDYAGNIQILKEKEYLSNNNKLTLKGKTFIDEIAEIRVESSNPYVKIHKSLQDKLLALTGKKQKMLQGKYAFIPSAKDLQQKLEKAIKKYSLNDIEKLEKVLTSYIERCNKANFQMVSTIEYYILKRKEAGVEVSLLATDYDCWDDKEDNNEYQGINI